MTTKTPYRHPAEYRGATWHYTPSRCPICYGRAEMLLTPVLKWVTAFRCTKCSFMHPPDNFPA